MDRTQTTTALLEQLKNPENSRAWTEFDRRIRPIVFQLAIRLGQTETEAADIAQDTLMDFLRKYTAGKYSREKGRLKSWILGMARNRIAATHRARARRREIRGESALMLLPGSQDLERIFDEELERELLTRAIEQLSRTRISASTLKAFELVVLRGMAPSEVAATLGIDTDAVYVAKHRCLERVRSICDQLRRTYELS